MFPLNLMLTEIFLTYFTEKVESIRVNIMLWVVNIMGMGGRIRYCTELDQILSFRKKILCVQ